MKEFVNPALHTCTSREPRLFWVYSQPISMTFVFCTLHPLCMHTSWHTNCGTCSDPLDHTAENSAYISFRYSIKTILVQSTTSVRLWNESCYKISHTRQLIDQYCSNCWQFSIVQSVWHNWHNEILLIPSPCRVHRAKRRHSCRVLHKGNIVVNVVSFRDTHCKLYLLIMNFRIFSIQSSLYREMLHTGICTKKFMGKAWVLPLVRENVLIVSSKAICIHIFSAVWIQWITTCTQFVCQDVCSYIEDEVCRNEWPLLVEQLKTILVPSTYKCECWIYVYSFIKFLRSCNWFVNIAHLLYGEYTIVHTHCEHAVKEIHLSRVCRSIISSTHLNVFSTN